MHADEQQDPHSPLVNFLWAHVGWLIFKNKDLTRLNVCTCYAKDILRDPFYARLERKQVWVAIVLGSWAAFFATGFVIELLVGGSFMNALKFGLSLLIWGVFVRTVVVWHSTWAVNSVAHVWGYRNYDTAESSRNNVIVALLSGGEGWHNNHHAFPRSARHGHMWWELDVTWLTIRILGYLGLARCLVLPKGKRLNSSGDG